jgi:Na+/H+-dicarboxylate symporter
MLGTNMAEQPRPGMSVGMKAIVGLAAGLAAGAGIVASASANLRSLGSAAEVVGTLWINAILMTIIPLVVSKIVVSIAGAGDARAVGRAGWRSAALFLGLLTAGATASALVMPTVFSWMPIDPAASAALRLGAGATAAGPAPTLSQMVLGLVPTNAIRAAAEGAIVPLLVFTIAFALGASRTLAATRDPLVAFFRAVDAAITVLLHWIVACSPYGVFALGVGLAIRVGVGIVGALAYYVAVSSAALVVATAGLYLVVYAGARVSPRRFARAAAPAQAVAFGTHSSMASLPAMIEGLETRLGLPQTATGFVLPLSLAVFKYSGPVWFVVVACFVGRLYDVAIDPSRFVLIVLTAVVTSFAVGGVPSGAVVVVAPVLAAAGLPAEAIGILLAIDPLPNAFRTVANVTGMMAVTVLAAGETGKDWTISRS